MMLKYDFLIVGAGFSGAVIAERLASQLNKKVLVIDKRNHIGGNCYDFFDKHGVLIQKYGAHLFHTKFKEVVDYLSRFTNWHKYEHRVKAWVNNEIYDLPINLNTINKFFGKKFTSKECEFFLKKQRIRIVSPKNSEEQVISKVGWDIYNNFFKNYTIKQWGVHPKKLAPEVTARIPVRFNRNDRYFDDPYQLMPTKGFTAVFDKMLNHRNITIKLNTDFKKIKNKYHYKNLIYTGCIDEYYDFKLGPLPYRSLRFRFRNFKKPFVQKFTVINYPNDFNYTKSVEIKHATKQKINCTTIGYEYPASNGDPYYPVPNEKNDTLYKKYLLLSKKDRNVFFLGRLGEYQYLNMDQVVFNALNLFKKVSRNKK